MSRMSHLLPAPLTLTQPDRAQIIKRLQQYGYALLSAEAVTGLVQQNQQHLDILRHAWKNLPSDLHLKDSGQYRRRRHGSYIQDTIEPGLRFVPHRPHWQPTTYNALHGGMLRWFEPLEDDLTQSRTFIALIQRLGEVFARVHRTHQPNFNGRWYIEAHPFRIDTTGGVGRPTPEGAHRDGVDYVAVVMVDRQGVRGGETRVFDADGPLGVRFTLEQPWSALLIDDARVIHESTPIQPLGPAGGHRDTLVLTYRAGGFQDPPPELAQQQSLTAGRTPPASGLPAAPAPRLIDQTLQRIIDRMIRAPLSQPK